MKFSSIFISMIMHIGILSLLILVNTSLHQRTEINQDFVSFHIVENNPFEKQKKGELFSNKQSKVFQNKKNESIQNLRQKLQSTKILPTKSLAIKNKDFESKTNIKEVKSPVPQIRKKLNKNKSVIKDNLFRAKAAMSVIPKIKNYRSAKLNQKFYSCSKSQRSIRKKNNIKNRVVNKNVTITALLGYNIYNYNSNFISISNLLNNNKRLNQNDIHISELLNKKINNNIYCN